MPGLVLELQRVALDPKVLVSDLLRKALVVSGKLGLNDLEKWIQNELKGYASPEEIPEYRQIHGEPSGFNPFHGWRRIQFPSSEVHERVSVMPCDQSVAEIETMVRGGSDGGILGMNYPPESEAMLRRAIGMNVQISLIVQLSSFTRILDAVRSAVLEWALKLEQDGILGEGLTFTPEEKKAADRASYSVMNFFGSVHSSQIQHGTQHSVQIQSSGLDVDALRDLIAALRSQAGSLPLSAEGKAELGAEIKTVEAQLGSPQPKLTVLRESLRTIRNILEGIAGNMISAELLKRVEPLLAVFGP